MAEAKESNMGLVRELAGKATARHWERIGVRKRWGICVPLYSLRSRRGLGVGDTTDLLRLIDWCRELGAEVVQLLPLNDMGLDSVPYSALSAFALDPLLLSVDMLEPVVRDSELARRVAASGERLNRSVRIDYQAVRAEKMALLWEIFQRAWTPELRRTLEAFEAENRWLPDYLAFRVLKERYDFRSWEEWGHLHPDRRATDELLARHEGRRTFHLYLQWLAHEQLGAVHEYAARRGVLLMGDIPILVARDSADVWRSPGYFRLDTVAGAPPDMYSQDGQYWGFPTYNWEALEAESYGWWRARLAYAERFFDLYRIDHVVGFFRIWTIRHGAANGREGRFVPGDESQWGAHGRRLLEMMIGASRMLPLAEDLGTIPPVCRQTLADLGICGLKVQRWERRWEGDGSIIAPADYPPLSVATLSTHDSETVAGWWEAFPGERGALWQAMGLTGVPPAVLPPEVHRRLLAWVAGGRAYFSIFLLQDLLQPFGLLPGGAAEHRVNVPGTVAATNWSWRCPVSLEELAVDGSLTGHLRELMAGR